MLDTIVRNGFRSGRRAFLRFAAAGTAVLYLGARKTARAYAQTKDYLASRIAAVYAHDRTMKYRKSQDNPSVKRLYSECLTEPLCPKSEKLLHAVYVDRSAGIKNLK